METDDVSHDFTKEVMLSTFTFCYVLQGCSKAVRTNTFRDVTWKWRRFTIQGPNGKGEDLRNIRVCNKGVVTTNKHCKK